MAEEKRKRGRPFKKVTAENDTIPIQIYPQQWLVDAVDSLIAEGLLPQNWSRSQAIQYAMSELVRILTGHATEEIKSRWGGRRRGERWLIPPDFTPPSKVYRGMEELESEAKNADILDQYPDETETLSWAYQWMNAAGKWERSTSYHRKKMAVEGAEFSVKEGHKSRIIFNGKVLKVLKPD